MTLGVFTDDYFPWKGGMGRHVFEVTRRLPQERLFVFSPAANDLPCHIRVMPPRYKTFGNIAFSLWLHRNLERLIAEYHLTCLNIHCGPGGLFLLQRPKVPVLATSHHTYWQQAHFLPGQGWKRVFLFFERRTYSLAERVLAVSEDTRRVLSERYGVSSARSRVVSNGVDSGRFFPIPQAGKIPDSVLYVGRLARRKGIEFLLNSIALASKEIPGLKLFLVGRGPKEESFRRLVAERGIDRNVHFLGFVSDAELNSWYNKCSVVVVPSVFEGFGMTALEAMAAGAAVIGTNVDGLRSLIRDGETSIVVPYGDCATLAKKIVDLLRNPELRDFLGRRGAERARLEYRWEAAVQVFAAEMAAIGG